MVEVALESVGDLKERLRAQEELLQRQQVEMNRQQSLLASVLHDIRSPLNVILVAAKVITDQSVRPERRERNSRLLNTAAETINSLCQDVLDFAKLSAGQMELSRITFHLRDCVVDLADGVRLLAQKKGVDVRVFVGPDAPTYLVGDPGRLRQILTNLMSNAVKFTQQGTVDVSIKLQRAVSENQVWIDFDVTDTGMGIHEEKLQNLFDPFRQAHGTLSTDLGGTGLGLAIAKQLVGCMGGELRVSSQPGKGTTFAFSACFGAKDQHDVPTTSPLQARRILILDENPESREDLENMCLSMGLHPVVAEQGILGVRWLVEAIEKDCAFPLAIINLEAGGGDAVFMIEQIHPDKRRQTRFLAYTAHGHRGEVAACQDAGVQAYLTGTLEKELLELMLLRLLAEQDPHEFITRHTVRPSVEENA